MAHFAQLNGNTVSQVIVINNEVINNLPDLEGESIGIAFCKSLFGENTLWAQTSYSGAFRGKFAGVGDTFDGTNFVTTTETQGA